LVIVVDSISFQLPITQLPISGAGLAGQGREGGEEELTDVEVVEGAVVEGGGQVVEDGLLLVVLLVEDDVGGDGEFGGVVGGCGWEAGVFCEALVVVLWSNGMKRFL